MKASKRVRRGRGGHSQQSKKEMSVEINLFSFFPEHGHRFRFPQESRDFVPVLASSSLVK
jgi:hypothetical protein